MPLNNSCWVCWRSCTPSVSMKIPSSYRGHPKGHLFIACCEWCHPLAGVWGSRPSSHLWNSGASAEASKWQSCFSTLSSTKPIMTYFPLNYVDCVIPYTFPFLLFFLCFLSFLCLWWSKHSKLLICVPVFDLVVYCHAGAAVKTLESLGWFFAYGKIYLISYRQHLETFYYIAVYRLVSLSLKDMYWNKCIYFISILL